MEIRQAHAGDAADIAAIWNWMITETLWTFTTVEKTVPEIAAMIGRGADAGGTFVAATGGQISGFVTYGQFRDGPGYARTAEHSIVLRPDAGGGGLGRGLMAAAEDHARAHDRHSMIAGASGANPRGIAFHAALGYRECARMPEIGFKNGTWLDLVLMQKIL